ncbi:MAG TPA: hypothetical protein VJV03_08595, partial [Pyrinomonadaceae bacterium]|nr:hypothetical protein [Pyrinomonadaceae bacterium]
MGRRKPDKLENRSEFKRLTGRVDVELQNDEPNWDLIDETLGRIKRIFKHVQFLNPEEKNSYTGWIDAAERRFNQMRQHAAKIQRLQLKSHLGSLRSTIEHLRSTHPLYQSTPRDAWKKVREIMHFLQHTHFASAGENQIGLHDLNELRHEVKKYEQEELRKPSPERFFT